MIIASTLIDDLCIWYHQAAWQGRAIMQIWKQVLKLIVSALRTQLTASYTISVGLALSVTLWSHDPSLGLSSNSRSSKSAPLCVRDLTIIGLTPSCMRPCIPNDPIRARTLQEIVHRDVKSEILFKPSPALQSGWCFESRSTAYSVISMSRYIQGNTCTSVWPSRRKTQKTSTFLRHITQWLARNKIFFREISHLLIVQKQMSMMSGEQSGFRMLHYHNTTLWL